MGPRTSIFTSALAIVMLPLAATVARPRMTLPGWIALAATALPLAVKGPETTSGFPASVGAAAVPWMTATTRLALALTGWGAEPPLPPPHAVRARLQAKVSAAVIVLQLKTFASMVIPSP